jgi:putative peptide zinc metalloprotease protein
MRKQLRPNPRLLTTLAVLGCLLLWLGLPLPRSVSAPAVLMADKSQVIYAPFSGQVEQLGVKRMDQVSEGHLLLTIGSRELEAELKVQELEIRVIAQEMDLLALSEEGRSMLKQKEEELEAVKARVQKLNSQLAQNQIRAEVAGLVSQWDDALVQGRYLSKDTVVGQVHAPQPRKVYAFVGEELIADIQVGDRAKFMAGDQPRAWAGVVERVSPVRKETITHLALTSLAKGDLPAVKDRRGNLVLLESHYLVEIVLEESPPGIWVGESGRAWLSSRGRSLLAQGARSSYRLLLRETNY